MQPPKTRDGGPLEFHEGISTMAFLQMVFALMILIGVSIWVMTQ